MSLPPPQTQFEIKTFDTAPDLEADLYRLDGSVPDLGDATAVKFIMKSGIHAAAKVAANCLLTGTPEDGHVRYEWQPADTDTPGDFLAEFEVEWNDGKFETFPSAGHLCILISRDLGGTATS